MVIIRIKKISCIDYNFFYVNISQYYKVKLICFCKANIPIRHVKSKLEHHATQHSSNLMHSNINLGHWHFINITFIVVTLLTVGKKK